MAALGMAPGFVIGLREGVEAALIIGLIVAYLRKTNRENLVKYVILGLIGAIIASVVVAGALIALSIGFEGVTEELFEGISAILAVAVLTFMIFWMMRVAKDVRNHFERRVEAVTGQREILGLAGIAFVAVFREGVETTLFMLGVTSVATTADAVAGVAIGILAAALIGVSLPWITTKISVRRFFQVTSILLIFMAAGLVATGVHELQDAFEIQAGSGQVYNLQGVFSSGEGNPMGYLLHGIVGYTDSPTQLQAVAYFSYLIAALVLWWFMAYRQTRQSTVETHAVEAGLDSDTAASSIGEDGAIHHAHAVRENESTQ